MSRILAVGLLVAGVLLASGQKRGQAPKATRPRASTTKPLTSEEIFAKLKERSDFPEVPQDPLVKFGHVLKKLQVQTGIDFRIKTLPFILDGINEPGEAGVVAERSLPAMKGVTLETYVRAVLARVPTPSGTVFMVRPGHIEVTTGQAVRLQVWGKDFKGPFLPLTHGNFQKTPLDKAFLELAEQSEYNILLDGRCKAKAKTRITASFLNLPLDTAVNLLADMAGLQIVFQDNAIYVTSPENALRMRGNQRREAVEEANGTRRGIGASVFQPSEVVDPLRFGFDGLLGPQGW
jgi:hypothetical protein